MHTVMVPRAGTRPMRIVALPLARVRIFPDARLKLSDHGLKSLLIFYHFDLVSPHAGRNELPGYKKLLKNATNKAASFWTSLGKAPEGSWKLWTYQLGERMADKIEFEELALRSVDPSLGPTIKQVGDLEKDPPTKIPLFYPPSLYPTCAEHSPLVHLQTLLASRVPRHRIGLCLWMLLTPFTIPITLIPLIPNLPLLFCVWRSWSHYRAYRTSQYLSSLLDCGLIEPNPSLELDQLYLSSTVSRDPPRPILGSWPPEESPTSAPKNISADRTSEAVSGTGPPLSGCMLLTRKAIHRILEMFRLPDSAGIDMARAMNQTHARLRRSP